MEKLFQIFSSRIQTVDTSFQYFQQPRIVECFILHRNFFPWHNLNSLTFVKLNHNFFPGCQIQVFLEMLA